MTKNSFKKNDYLTLIIIQLLGLFFIFGSYLFFENSFQYFSGLPDQIYQHAPLIENLRKTFYVSHELIPQFMPNLGGGQNAFNYTYHGLLNPIILPFYFMPWLSGYSYLILIITIIILLTAGLIFYWLRQRFALYFASIGTLSCLFAGGLYHIGYSQYMFITYMPWLIIALINVDRLINKNKYLGLIISISLLGLTNFVALLPCFIVIILYAIFVILEKNSNLKKAWKNICRVLICQIASVFLISFVLLPSAGQVLTNRINSRSSFSLFDLFYPSIYFFPSIKNLNLQRDISSPFSLGISIFGLLFVILLLFCKDRKWQILSGVFVTICLFPICVYILNAFNYIDDKVLIAFTPIFGLLITQSFYFINQSLLNIKNFPINKKSLLAFLSIFAILSISIPTIQNTIYNRANSSNNSNMPQTPAMNKFSSKQYVNFTAGLKNAVWQKLQINKSIYRSMVSPMANFCQYPSIDKVLSENYFTDSIYTSSNNSAYQNYHTNMLWQPPACTNIYWSVTNNSSVFGRTLMAEKYLFLELNNISTSLAGYQNTSPYIWENNNTFSIGYASNNLFSNIDNMTDIQQKAALIQGISLNKNTAENQKPNTQNIEQLDLSNIFAQQQKGLSVFKLSNPLTETYKLPKTLHNKLLFLKIKLSDSLLNEKSANNILNINNVQTNFIKNPQYNSSSTELKFIIDPDTNNKIENLKISLSAGTWPIDSIQAFTMPISDIQNAPKQFDQMNVTKFNTQGLFGNINITRPDSVIAFSLGYDPGFSLKIDGQNTPIFEANNGIIGGFIKPGFHNIELTYSAPYYNTGIVFSSITLMLIIGCTILPKTKLANKLKK
ncbi:MAG: YfhO family protein [Bifidobacteriaceae bacterium]|jgi:hypothetical protein|nr:YfhO family protein [Bifidobacteriaceae bacterium]